MKYLPLYYEWMERGVMPTSGLCNFFGRPQGPDDPCVLECYSEFELMLPNRNDRLKNQGYWATELKFKDNRNYAFCELRQNIVLFMAAMNNEL